MKHLYLINLASAPMSPDASHKREALIAQFAMQEHVVCEAREGTIDLADIHAFFAYNYRSLERPVQFTRYAILGAGICGFAVWCLPELLALLVIGAAMMFLVNSYERLKTPIWLIDKVLILVPNVVLSNPEIEAIQEALLDDDIDVCVV